MNDVRLIPAATAGHARERARRKWLETVGNAAPRLAPDVLRHCLNPTNHHAWWPQAEEAARAS